MTERHDVLDLDCSDLARRSAAAGWARWVETVGLPCLWLLILVTAARALGL